MIAEIVTIGDEILIGQVIDTNSAWIAQNLNKIGIEVQAIISVSDTAEAITEALETCSVNAEFVFITGGLGPTKDDITKQTIAHYFNSKLVFNEEVFNQIKLLASQRGFIVNELNKNQSFIPDNCKIIHNSCGTAAGMWFENKKTSFIFMPGVPYEMKEMMTNYILPELKKRNNGICILHQTILTQGIAESLLAGKLQNFENQLPDTAKLAYLPSPGIVRLRLTVRGINEASMHNVLKNETAKLISSIGEYIYGYNEDTLEEVIGKILNINNLSVCTAESCTGGNISQMITSVPGSSDYFKGSIVAYNNQIKTTILGVSDSDLIQKGAVSQIVVEQMAVNVKKLFQTDFSIAVSGIAGPKGGSSEKPVGTTWIAVATPQKVVSQKFLFGEHRGRNITKASLTALNMLRKAILEMY